jgi:hypothetical protein
MRHALVIVVLVLIGSVAHATPAPVERFIGKETILALEADLSQVDAADAARFVCDLTHAIAAKDAGELAQAREQAAGQRALVQRWIDNFRAATGGGPSAIVCVTETEWTLDGGYALYVQVPPAGDAARVEVLLGGGPEVRKRKQGQPRQRFDWHSDVKIWPERVVGRCIGATNAPPKPGGTRRADFAEALAAGSAGERTNAGARPAAPPAARIVIVPDENIREKAAGDLHATCKFIKPMQWLAVRYDAAPLPLHVPAKLTVVYRARDAAAAAEVVAGWKELIETIYAAAGLEPAEIRQITQLLKPSIDGDRAILSIAAAELPRLIADARPAIRKAWRIPNPDRSKSTRRGGDADPRGTGLPDGRAAVGYD